MIIANVPAGAASQQFLHYAQGITNGILVLYTVWSISYGLLPYYLMVHLKFKDQIRTSLCNTCYI